MKKLKKSIFLFLTFLWSTTSLFSQANNTAKVPYQSNAGKRQIPVSPKKVIKKEGAKKENPQKNVGTSKVVYDHFTPFVKQSSNYLMPGEELEIN